jgi:hypothetical protein
MTFEAVSDQHLGANRQGPNDGTEQRELKRWQQ